MATLRGNSQSFMAEATFTKKKKINIYMFFILNEKTIIYFHLPDKNMAGMQKCKKQTKTKTTTTDKNN